MASHLYFGIENSLLMAVITLVSRQPFHHLSLHHDGARVDYATMKVICEASGGGTDISSTSETCCTILSQSIFDETGYRVALVDKKDIICLRC